jgi:hypothetical protein
MTNQNSPVAAPAPETLHFGSKPVRFVKIDDVPYFLLDDLCAASAWKSFVADYVNSPTFPSFGKAEVQIADGDEIRSATALSCVGVYYWTDLADATRGQKIAAWAKRQAHELAPGIPSDNPAMFLTTDHEGRFMPPRPLKYSGWRAEWFALKDARTPRRPIDPRYADLKAIAEAALQRAIQEANRERKPILSIRDALGVTEGELA